jgi:hypothetical protein
MTRCGRPPARIGPAIRRRWPLWARPVEGYLGPELITSIAAILGAGARYQEHAKVGDGGAAPKVQGVLGGSLGGSPAI